MSKELDEAAETWARPRCEASGYIQWHKMMDAEIETFKAGAQWAEKHSPRVMALVAALELALSFAPKGPVPEGLGPEFYHTLDYDEEVKLQNRIDAAREALRAWRGE